MKKGKPIIIVLFFAFWFLAVIGIPSTHAQIIWLPFKDDQTIKPLQYPVNVLTPTRFSFKAISSGLVIKPIVKEQTTYKQLLPPGGRIFGELGKPGLPGFTRLVFVPKDAQIKITVNEGEAQELIGYKIYPLQEQPEDNSDFKPGPFIIDEAFYNNTKTPYPDSLVSIQYDWVRGCKVAIVNVHTARYNPLQEELTYYPDLDIDIQFEGGEDTYIPTGKRSIFFEDNFARIFPNYEIVRRDIADLLEVGRIYQRVDLLIITPAAFEDQADQLAEWKREKGFVTRVVTLDQINTAQGGTTAAHIRAYIKDVFDTRSISYVLLFGDAEFIPPHYVTPHPTAHGGTLMGTDLYYAEMDYTGYFPDLAIGRIPVNNADEAQRVVNKIIAYEQNPPNEDGFYERILHAAYFQDDNNNGTADRAFAQTVEEIRDFFLGEGYPDLPREYTTNSPAPQRWVDGTDIPGYLEMPGFPWNGSAGGIIDEINNGSFLVVHRDHGTRDGWDHPGFIRDNLEDLNNNDLLPLVLSINCQTGWFDNETDAEALDTDADSESFAEQFLTMEGGAVAVIAATRNSPSFPNNDLEKAYVDCIWNDMLSGYPTAEDPDASELEGSNRLGDALNYAKFYVATQWNTLSECQRPFEIYHCLGDPTMELWTGSPDVTFDFPVFDPIPGYGFAYTLPFGVDRVLVSMIQDGEIIGQGISKDGQVTIYLDEPLRYSDDTSISLSKRGYVTKVVPVCIINIENIAANPNVVWPPNHKMVTVGVNVMASDTCDSTPVCKIISVNSNEPENGLGDGDTAPDWEITGDLTLKLRAERSGQGNGRVYTITVECTDASGNISTRRTVSVTVPRDQRNKK